MKTIAVTLISFNDESIIRDFLSSIRNQNYNQDFVNIYLEDGGSTDATIAIAKEYNCIINFNPNLKESQNIRGGKCFSKPNEDFIFFTSADNRFYNINMFTLMVEKILKKNAFGAQSLFFDHQKSDSLYSRYCSIVGGTDPIAIGLNKNDRIGYFDDFKKKYNKLILHEDKNTILVEFDQFNTTTLGANGFMLNNKYNNIWFHKALHIDGCYFNIINNLNKKIIFLKNCHSHHHLNMSFLKMVKRRFQHKDIYFNKDRLYKIYNHKSFVKLVLLILYFHSIFLPILKSIILYLKSKDLSVFLHLFVGLSFVYSYGFNILKKLFSTRFFS